MNRAAFDEFLGVIDDAIGIADDAVKAAEAARPASSTILVKVAARSACRSAASELIKTGAFKDYNQDELAKFLEQADNADLVPILEKLASRAVFPLSADFGDDGDLVDKPTNARAEPKANESTTDLWGRCCAEAGLG